MGFLFGLTRPPSMWILRRCFDFLDFCLVFEVSVKTIEFVKFDPNSKCISIAKAIEVKTKNLELCHVAKNGIESRFKLETFFDNWDFGSNINWSLEDMRRNEC